MARIILAEGNIDYKPGDWGKYICQTHERFLREYQVKYTHDLGWKRVTLTDREIEILKTIGDFNWKKINDPNISEDADFMRRLNKFVESIDLSKLNSMQLRVLAKVDPVSIHTDIRFQRLGPTKDDYFEGGEIFKPGNQFYDNPLLDFEKDQPYLFDFKKRRESEVGHRLVEVIKGPLGWMEIGELEPYIAKPGEVGASENRWGRLTMREKGKWWAGKQDKHAKEFWFEGKYLKGCFQFNYVPIGGGRRQWMMLHVKNKTKEDVLGQK